VIDDMVRRGDLLQGLALMPLLAARRLVRWSAQAFGPSGRGGFLSPSLDGGFPLLELFKPSRRSGSPIRAIRAAISAACAAISAISSSRDGSRCESGFALIESLNRNTIPLWRKIYSLSRDDPG
jgi:hypothetical protein